MKRIAPFAVLLLILSAGGCGNIFGGGSVANDTPARQLVREADGLNKIAKSAYDGILAAHNAKLISDAKLVSLETPLDAVEAGRKQLTADALAGNVSKFDATKNALLESLAVLAASQLEANATKPKTVTPDPPPVDSEPTAPPVPQ